MRSEGQRETGNLTLNLVVAGEIFCNLPLPLGLQEEYIQREPQEERGRAHSGTKNGERRRKKKKKKRRRKRDERREKEEEE